MTILKYIYDAVALGQWLALSIPLYFKTLLEVYAILNIRTLNYCAASYHYVLDFHFSNSSLVRSSVRG